LCRQERDRGHRSDLERSGASARKLCQQWNFVTLRTKVETSSRRSDKADHAPQQLLNAIIVVGYELGSPRVVLARLYQPIR
jgi:hypothetical protein